MKILALNSKHSTEYWDATNEYAAFLAAFRFNDKLGCYGDLTASEIKDAEAQHAELKALSADLIGLRVPQALLREAEDKVKELPKATHYVDTLKSEANLYRQAKKGNGTAAKMLLMRRQQNEYEGWEIVYVQKPGAPRKKR